ADGDVFFFEDFEDADVGDTASEPSTEGQTDPHPCRLGTQASRMTRKAASERLHRTNDLIQTLHGGPHTIPGFARLLSLLANQTSQPRLGWQVRCHFSTHRFIVRVAAPDYGLWV